MRHALLIALMLFVVGCETSKQRMWAKVDKEGTWSVYCTQRGTVIGKGDTSTEASGMCGEFKRNTSGTGFSDNFVKITDKALCAVPAIAPSCVAGAFNGSDPDRLSLVEGLLGDGD